MPRKPATPADPDARIERLHALVRQRHDAALAAEAAAAREKQRRDEQRRDCVAHAELLACRAKGLNGIKIAEDMGADVTTDVSHTANDGSPVQVGVSLTVRALPRGRPLVVLVVAYAPGEDAEEPSYWLPPKGAAVSAGVVEHSRRLTFAEALDLLIAAVEDALEAGGDGAIPF